MTAVIAVMFAVTVPASALGGSKKSDSGTDETATEMPQYVYDTEQRYCPDEPVLQPFVPFGDLKDYVAAPDGTFEKDAAGWTRTQGSEVVAENAPLKIGDADTKALKIPKRGGALSPPMCIDLTRPTFRFFFQGDGVLDDKLEVELVFPDLDKRLYNKTAKVRLLAPGVWTLSEDLAGLQPALKDDGTGILAGVWRVAFRFTASSGHWKLDNLFVDPRMRS